MRRGSMGAARMGGGGGGERLGELDGKEGRRRRPKPPSSQGRKKGTSVVV